MKKEIKDTFEPIVNSLPKTFDYEKCVLKMEYYTREPGVGYCAYCVNSLGEKTAIDADINYDFSFLFKIIEWNEVSENEARWNMASFSVDRKGTFETNTWWDDDFQRSLYNDS